MSSDYKLPLEGLVRLNEVLKVIPVSRATWYKGIKQGLYPKPKSVGKRAKGYNVEDIRKLINE